MSMEALPLPKVLFCRTVAFRAAHHYALAKWSEAENRAAFGEAFEPHTHDWRLTLWLEAPVDETTGMMIDLLELDRVLREQVVEPFHGNSINDGDTFFQSVPPTTETLAVYFAKRLAPQLSPARLARLRIAESPDIFAEWHA